MGGAIRTFHHRQFPVERLLAAKRGRRVSVCLPARDEASTIAPIVRTIVAELVHGGLVEEVLVVDDGSTDATAAVAAAAGARVVPASGSAPRPGPAAGKGAAMWKSLHEAEGDIIVWCDADVRNFGARFVTGLLGPLLTHDDVGFVKAFYARPLDGRAGEGGRVTELVARPVLALLFPELVSLRQPLAGECAGRRELLEKVPFVTSYGVDIGLVLDIAGLRGSGVVAQVDLGERVHRNRPLEELRRQATDVLHTALLRAGVALPPAFPAAPSSPKPTQRQPPVTVSPPFTASRHR